MQFGIISGAMLACLLHMEGTELKMILNVSVPHLLCLMTNQAFSISFPLFPPPLLSVKIKIRHAYHSSVPVNHNLLLKLHSPAWLWLCGG